MRRAIVTGPTGAVGIALITYLTKQGVAVTAVCHRGSARIKNLTQNHDINQSLLTIVECQLDEIKLLPKLLEKAQIKSTLDVTYDIFYHLAWANTFGADARNNVEAQLKNIAYTIDAVEVAAQLGCKRFIGTGSQAEYGRVEGMLTPDTPCFPENGYGIAKLSAGQLSRLRAHQLGIEHIWTRILSVYGPYDGEGTLISSLISKLSQGIAPAMTPGQQTWDYMYSMDAAKALYLVGEKGIDGKVYVLGSGEARPLRDYAEIIREKLAPDVQIAYGKIPYADRQVMHLQADISELRKDTGFEPEWTFEAGIEEILAKKEVK